MLHSNFPVRATVTTAVALSLAGPLAAQGFDVYVSLTSDDDVGGQAVLDEEIARHGDGAVARLALPAEAFVPWSGEVLGDIDAFHDHGTDGVASEAFYFSLQSNELGFADGDVLRFEGGTLTEFIPEDAFGVLTGVDGDLDVDAFHLDDDGTVLFSFAEDETSTTLSGDVPGEIADGDVLLWPAGSSAASILYTESQITAIVNQALGNATASGDTKSLARDPSTGAVLFTVQSPSSDDGSVISDEGGGMLVAAHAEADFGFSGSGEIDALTVVRTSFPSLDLDASIVTAGDDATVAVGGAPANSSFVLVASGGLGSMGPLVTLDGWGGLVLDEDPILTATLLSAPYFVITTDAMGDGNLSVPVPAALPPSEWTLQAIAPAPFVTSTNPVRLTVEQ